MQLRELGEDRIEIVLRAGIENVELKPERAGRFRQVFCGGLGGCRIGGVDEQGEDRGAGSDFMQQLQPLRATWLFSDVMPVMFPPGLFMLATSPVATGSVPVSKTIGMVCVAALAASADATLPGATSTLTG